MSDADNNRVNAGASQSSATPAPMAASAGFTPEALAQMSQMFLPFMEMFRNSLQPGNLHNKIYY